MKEQTSVASSGRIVEPTTKTHVLSYLLSASEDAHDDDERDEVQEQVFCEPYMKRQFGSFSEFGETNESNWTCMQGVLPSDGQMAFLYDICPQQFCYDDSQSDSLGSVAGQSLTEQTQSVSKLDHVWSADNDSRCSSSSNRTESFKDLNCLPSLMSENSKSSLVVASNLDTFRALPPLSVESQTLESNLPVFSRDSQRGNSLLASNHDKSIDGQSVQNERSSSDIKDRFVRLIKKSSFTTNRFLKEKLPHTVRGDECLSVKSSENNDKSKTASLVQDLKASIAIYGRFDIRCADICCALAELCEQRKAYHQALKLFREAIAIFTTKLGDNHSKTVETKIRLGKVLEKVGEYDRAIDLYFHVLCMRKAILHDNDVSIPETLTYIANALKLKGNAAQAIKELKKALKLFRSTLGDSHPTVTDTVDEISRLYFIAGDYQKTTAILEEVVKLKTATSGMYHDDVAKSLFDLSLAYEAKGEHEKAIKSLKKCYTIITRIHGDRSDDAIMVLERIAEKHRNSGGNESANKSYLV
jgi:tetratricopeptide (TPR) repeat protein